MLQRDARHDRGRRQVGLRLRSASTLRGTGGSGGQDDGATAARVARDLLGAGGGTQHLGERRPLRIAHRVVLGFGGLGDIRGVLDDVVAGGGLALLLLVGEGGRGGVVVLLPVDDHRALVEALGQQRDELLVDEEQVDLLLLHHRAGLGRGGAGVEQDDVGAEATVGAQGHEEAAVVAAQHADLVALADAGTVQGLGQLVRLVVEFAVGDRAGVVDDGGVVRILGCAEGQQAGGGEGPLVDGLQCLTHRQRSHQTEDAGLEQGQGSFSELREFLEGDGGIGSAHGGPSLWCCGVYPVVNRDGRRLGRPDVIQVTDKNVRNRRNTCFCGSEH